MDREERIRAWERLISTLREGDLVGGKVTRRIKGGFLLEIGGVPVFLPNSHAGLTPGAPVDLLGEELHCKILKIDVARMNVVVSRRGLLGEERGRDALSGEADATPEPPGPAGH